MNLFESGPLFPIIASVLGSILYAGLFNFSFSRIIQKFYSYLTGSMVFKVQSYIYIINIPAIVLILSGVIFNGCLLPFDVTLKMDEIYILIVSGYICYLQESRHTPIRGFVFIKDTLIILTFLLIYLMTSAQEDSLSIFIITIICLYFLSLVIQSFTNQIECRILLTLGIREKNIYSSSFLLTEKSQTSNFLEIKDIVQNYPEEIKEEIEDFVCVASGLKQSNQDLLILTNFAKLFIPIKKAYQINEEIQKKRIEEQFVENWKEMTKELSSQMENCQEEDENDKSHSFNHSASSLLIKKTTTTDSFLENEDLEKKEEEQSVLYKVIKYVNYPIYLTSKVTGRPRYFVDYFLCLVLILTMFVLANAISYFSTEFPSNQNLISLLFAGVLYYPMASYFIRISEGSNDYDFMGIFMQGVINKHLILALSFLIRGVFFDQVQLEGGSKALASHVIRIGTYSILGAFLIWKRFAMRITNFKVFVGILATSQLVKIVTENAIHYST